MDIVAKEFSSSFERYLLIDSHPNSKFPEYMRLRSNLFDVNKPYFLTVDD